MGVNAQAAHESGTVDDQPSPVKSVSTVRLLVPIKSRREEQWVELLKDAAPHFVFVIKWTSAALTNGDQQFEKTELAVDAIPSFAELLGALRNSDIDCCLLLGDDIGRRLMGLAADYLSIPIFRLVVSEEQLRNLPDLQKPKSDLFFIAASTLFEAAIKDHRYGRTLLPIGHLEQDLVLASKENPSSVQEYAGDEFGDGFAARRMVSAIEDWQHEGSRVKQPELSIIVPAYKESANVSLVCDRLLGVIDQQRLDAEILLVDDASPDDTYAQGLRQMWKSPRIRALTKGTPRGMGNAITHGIRMSRSPYIAITMGDGSDEVARIPEMLHKVRDENYGLAIGSRYRHRVNYENVPGLYRFWSSIFRFTTRCLIGLRLSDYTNAFRVFDRSIFAKYGPEGGGFEISPEITFKAWFASRRVTEVDVRHLKRAAGQSTFSFMRAGPGYGTMLIKAFVNRLTGRWFSLDW